tara:strand:+ start:137 stop:286 length:150 start_codon:yes stop_codon:yes gene_type:complete
LDRVKEGVITSLPINFRTIWTNQCTIMSWEEVDQKVTEHMAELNKDRAF